MAMSTETKLGRLSYLTQNGGTKLCKQLFLNKVVELIPHNEDPELWTMDSFLQMNRHKIGCSKKSEQILFPVEGSHTQFEHWDLSLLIKILETACELKGDLKERLLQLKKLRNKLSHFGDSEMSDAHYDHYFEKVTVIFEIFLKELNDKELETTIRCMITKSEKGEICDKELAKAFQELCKSIKESEETTRQIITQEHRETRRQIAEESNANRERLEIGNRQVMEKLEILFSAMNIHPMKDASSSSDKMTVPVKIKPVNCDTETDENVSRELVDIFTEAIENNVDHTEFPEDDQEKRRRILEVFNDLNKKGYTIARVEIGCVLLHFQFSSVSSLLSFYIDYIKGNLETYLDELKKAVQIDGRFQDLYFEMYLYKDDLYEILQNIGEMIEEKKGASIFVAETSDGRQLSNVPSIIDSHTNGYGGPSVLLWVKPLSQFDERDFDHTLEWLSEQLTTLYKTPLHASILEIEDKVHSSECVDNTSNSDTESTASEWELILDDAGQFDESYENQRSVDNWQSIQENDPGILQTRQMVANVIAEREVTDSYSREDSLADKWNQKQSRSPKESCRYDGRLILLSDEDRKFIKDACKQENVIGQRHGGTVFKTFSGGFGMHIAIKKLTAVTKEKRNSIRKEMFCSRILHPFILPLLSTFVERTGLLSEFYLISPYCENADLYSVLENNRENPDIFRCRLNQVQRIRIALQTALAIQYLHTPVPNVRGIIWHQDICSQNIVLDNSYNARLIDFGLAREIDEIHETTAYKPRMPASTQWDYYNFGVVIREMLTGLPPSGKRHVPLRCMSTADVINNLEDLWQTDGDASMRNAYALNIAAQNCIDAQEGIFSLKEQVIDLIKDIYNEPVMNKSESKKCALCMINEDGSAAARMIKHKANCKEQIRLCIACEKNSFLNPVACYSCGATLDPIIGRGWGALLIADNDTDDEDNANAFKNDMEKFRKILISKAPLFMGIREDHVKTVAPNEEGRKAKTETLLPQISKAIEEINAMNIHTLIVYFSCHSVENENTCDQLASKDDTLTVTRLQEMLSFLRKVQKVIVILDRCYVDKLTLPDKVIVQINACGSEECTPAQEKRRAFQENRRAFIQYLISGLQSMSQGKFCEEKCGSCEDHWTTRKDYITVGRLQDFIVRHMTTKGHPKPRSQLEGNADVNIAYYTDEEIILNFVQGGQKQNTKNINDVSPEFCQNMDELKTILLAKIFERDEGDLVVCINSDMYRKENRYEICDSIEKVMMAWILRKSLIVTFEKKK